MQKEFESSGQVTREPSLDEGQDKQSKKPLIFTLDDNRKFKKLINFDDSDHTICQILPKFRPYQLTPPKHFTKIIFKTNGCLFLAFRFLPTLLAAELAYFAMIYKREDCVTTQFIRIGNLLYGLYEKEKSRYKQLKIIPSQIYPCSYLYFKLYALVRILVKFLECQILIL
ncbi:hypothetical protein BpHYR1_004423 [Brachionus plicatilis]|uniref:Uncharacterized protein n=1 Tax=Brachionus plicatilis TaxID=10195 RepID=A0A3M7T4E5_BRAPC|nr:hypothetical protein BpHYR1_004423 [Brachionus plicatilis]